MNRILSVAIPLLMTGTPSFSKYCEPDTIQEIDIQNQTTPIGKKWEHKYLMTSYKLITDGNREIKCNKTIVWHQYRSEIVKTIYTCGKLIVEYDGMTMIQPSHQKDPLLDHTWWLKDRNQQSFIMKSTPFECQCINESDDTKKTGICTKTLSNEFVKIDLIIEDKYMLVDKPRPQI